MHPPDEATRTAGPKQKDRRQHSYNESVDEPAALIQGEPVDIERETPADDTEPVERTRDRDTQEPPAFEE
jgi:hypothetical protein